MNPRSLKENFLRPLTFLLLYVLISCNLFSQRDIQSLAVMQDDYPRVFFFRQTERPEYYIGYDAWQNEWDDLMGIQGKALGEELADRSLKHEKYYSRFKQNYPEQLVLLHYNGNACDPLFETKEFFDGHWLYTNGPKIMQDLPEKWTYSKVKVEDADYFVEYTGRFMSKKEDVAIVALDENGKPNWHHCEQAIIREIDYENDVLTIVRGAYKDRPLSFEAGKARIVAHVIEGPWFGGSETVQGGNNMLWLYNHSTTCPKDEKGRNCNDVMAELMAKRFKPGGSLYHFDGFELDVLFNTLEYNSYFYLQELGDWHQGKRYTKYRAPDCDGDGELDMGIIDGVNVYEKGVDEFVRTMREELDKVDPNIIFQADAGWKTQRGFGVLNGVESEGYGKMRDGVMNWSNVLNTHVFWNANSGKPNFSYLNHKIHSNRLATHRVGFSAAMYAGSAIAQYSQPPRDPDGSVGIYDEFVKGIENELGWMGEPVSEAVHLVDNEKDMLNGETPSKQLLDNLRFEDCQAMLEDGAIKMIGEDDTKDMKMIIPAVELTGKEFTLAITTHCAPKKGFGPEYARMFWVRPTDEQGESLLDDHEWWFSQVDRRFSYTNHKQFTNYVFFHNVKKKEAYIEVKFESIEPVYIERLQLYAAADVMYREFENALVITNPGLYDYTFDLNELTPGEKYKRIKGTAFQDPETNNGQQVGDKVTLGKHDALFLIKVK